MTQIKTRNVSLSSIVGSADFRRGCEDYRNGIANFDGPLSKSSWHYERGRLFAASLAAQNKPLPSRFRLSDRSVPPPAIRALNASFDRGDVL